MIVLSGPVARAVPYKSSPDEWESRSRRKLGSHDFLVPGLPPHSLVLYETQPNSTPPPPPLPNPPFAHLYPAVMSGSTVCAPSTSVLEKGTVSESRYFVGISPAVVFVASLSFLAFSTVVLGGLVIASVQFVFFLALPLASAAAGAYLVVAPETTPLGSDPAVLLLLRTAGAIAIAYAGSAILVGRSRCSKVKTAHLALVAASLGVMASAFATDDASVLAVDVSGRAAGALGKIAVLAAVGAVITSSGPCVAKRIRGGKPAEPGPQCFGDW